MATTYTLAELLSWMRGEDRTVGWDAVLAFERNKTNLLLIQDYIVKFSQGDRIGPITGAIPTGGTAFREYIQNFVMDVPRLSYEDTGLDGSRANLRMAVLSGNQASIEKEVNRWKVTRILNYDPLDGPQLFLDLLLSQVSGDISADDKVRLDLSKSDNFRLMFAETLAEQELAGRIFKTLFNRLDDEKRVWTLGTIKRGNHVLLRPRSFRLRTQKGAQPGDGAILALVRMEGRDEGDDPGTAYRYLIPKDADKDYSATVLIKRQRILLSALTSSIGGAIGCTDFRYVLGNSVASATALEGGVAIPGGQPVPLERLTYEYGFGEQGGTIWADPQFRVVPFVLPASNGFVIEVRAHEVTVKWEVLLRFPGIFEYVYVNAPISGGDAGRLTPDFSVSVSVTYELDESAGLIVLKNFSCVSGLVSSRGMSGVMGVPEFGDEVFAAQFSEEHPAGEVARASARFSETLSRKIYLTEESGYLFEAGLLEQRIKVAIEKNFSFAFSASEFIEENLEFYFGNTLVPEEIRYPYDAGVFGRINPRLTTFAITESEPRLAAGTPFYAFEVFPERNGLKWAVEDLQRRAVGAGTIDENTGVYTPPAANQIEGRFTRVRVTATDPVTQFSSSALVTVVRSRLTINPLIQICNLDESVPLKLGYLKDDEDSPAPTVVINNPVPGESGSIESNNGVYTYVSNKDVVEGKTYVMDEIVATYKGYTASVYMVVTQTNPGITIQAPDSLEGLIEVALRAKFNNMDLTQYAEWSIEFNGPGSWHSETPGVYKVDEMAPQAFVFIRASYDAGPLGILEGHLLLALPLHDIPDVPLSVAETDGETGLAY
ncbi:hypothetical protein [Pseudomonas sp. R151218B TE3479]